MTARDYRFVSLSPEDLEKDPTPRPCGHMWAWWRPDLECQGCAGIAEQKAQEKARRRAALRELTRFSQETGIYT